MLLTASLCTLFTPSPILSLCASLPCQATSSVARRCAWRRRCACGYGRFFYRFADGESAADVYDRVTGGPQHLTDLWLLYVPYLLYLLLQLYFLLLLLLPLACQVKCFFFFFFFFSFWAGFQETLSGGHRGGLLLGLIVAL